MNQNVGAYILLAEQCLKDSRILHTEGSYRGAAGRAYYAYFDAIRALLASKDISTKSHSAVRTFFGEHFVKDAPFSRQDAKAFHELFLLRQNSDCNIDEVISEVDSINTIESTSEIIIQTEVYLHSISHNS